jgi:hypothetical protein
MKTFPKALLTTLAFSIVLSACSQPEKDKGKEVKDYTSIIKTGKEVTDPVHGKETGFFYGAIGSEKSNGVAYIRTYEDGVSVVTANLNVHLAEQGTHYEAYLLSADEKKKIDLGELTSIIGDARHSVRFETKENIQDMLTLEVRLEKGLLKGSEVIATGVLKVPAPAVSQ